MKTNSTVHQLMLISITIGALLLTTSCMPALSHTDLYSSAAVEKETYTYAEAQHNTPKFFSIKAETNTLFQPKQIPRDTSPALEFAYDQVHPALGRTETGLHFGAYRDNTPEPGFETVFWTFSADDGETYDPGYAINGVIGGDYPAVRLWEGTRFFGTLVTDPFQSNGGDPIVVEAIDPLDYEQWLTHIFPYSGFNWKDMVDADIACDSSQLNHEWGVCSYVMSFDGYGSWGPYTDAPTILFADPEDPEGGVISWFYYNHTQHTHATFDKTTHEAHMIYDYNKDAEGQWTLLVWVLDFEDPLEGASILYEIGNTAEMGNLRYPSIAVHDGNVIILCQTDLDGNQDIMCLSGDITGSLTQTIPFDSTDDETYPELFHIQDQRYVATFTIEGDLYKAITNDGGQTWQDPVRIDSGIAEYKTCDISEQGKMALFEKSNDDIDIWLENNLAGLNEPEFDISFRGGLGVAITISNKQNSSKTATNVIGTVQITGGILDNINMSLQGIEPQLAPGESFTIKSGLFLGFGKILVSAQATCDEEITGNNNATGRQFFILSLV